MVTLPGARLFIGVVGGVFGHDFALGIGAITSPSCVASEKGSVRQEQEDHDIRWDILPFGVWITYLTVRIVSVINGS